MKLIPFQGLFPKINLITDQDSFFANTKFKYAQFAQNGFFEKDPSEALYVYHIQGEKFSHYGLVTGLDINDLLNDKILPHEKTLAAKEQEQLNLTLERKALIKPILLGFKPFKGFEKFVMDKLESKADITQELKKKKEIHRYWKISLGEEVEFLVNMFKKKVQKSYIADGHHRCSISKIIWEQSQQNMMPVKLESMLCVLMPFDQLKIYDFNRVIELGSGISGVELMAELCKIFTIKTLSKKAKPKAQYELTMCLENTWFSLVWKKRVFKKFKKEKRLLDYHLLNELVIKAILNIEDVRDHPGIKYIPGPDKFKGIKKELKLMERGVAFMLYPLTSSDICYYADRNKTLPPKSSYFLPRIVNGMIIQELK